MIFCLLKKKEGTMSNNLENIFLYPLYTAEEEKLAFEKYANETDATRKKELQDDIVMHNVRLVYKVAHNYSSTEGITADELFSYGVEGVMRALKSYDIHKGIKFSTYVYPYIIKYIRKGWHESQLVALPEYIWEGLTRFTVARNDFINKYGRNPTYKPCLLDSDFEKISEMEALIVKPGDKRLDHSAYKTVVQVWESKEMVSLDESVNNESDTEISNFLPSDKVVSDEVDWCAMELHSQIKQLKESEPDGDKIADILKYTMCGYSRTKIADIMNISVKEVRRYYNKGCSILQKSKVLYDMCMELV